MKNQFDERYLLKPERMDNPGLKKRSGFVVNQQKTLLAGIRRRPSNIAWFENALDSAGSSASRPLVGIYCNMPPVEPVYALGALPLRLCCGNAAMVQAGEEVLHGEICPLVKSSFAEILDAGRAPDRCSAVILPAACDPKRKLGEALSDFMPVFMLNLPPEQDFNRYAGMAAGEIKRMIKFLEHTLKKRLNRKSLLAAVKLGRKRSSLARQLQKIRSEKPEAMSIRDVFIVAQAAYAAVDQDEWIAEVEKTIAELESYQPERKRLRPRIVLTGAPVIWPNFKLLNLIEESGADVVADTVCSGTQSLVDAVSCDETGKNSLVRAFASKYIFGSMCPCFVSQGTRISRVIELAREFRADGVINHGLRLCQLFDMEVYRLSRIMKEQKIPFANVRTDYSFEDSEQLRVRIEAFLETLV